MLISFLITYSATFTIIQAAVIPLEKSRVCLLKGSNDVTDSWAQMFNGALTNLVRWSGGFSTFFLIYYSAQSKTHLNSKTNIQTFSLSNQT